MAILTPALIKAFRKRYGLTQAELARRVGYSRTTLIRWETGKVRAPEHLFNTLLGVAQVLKSESCDPKQ